MKTIYAILLLCLATPSFAKRRLSQSSDALASADAPGPISSAPGPYADAPSPKSSSSSSSNLCPLPTTPGAQCVTKATSFQTQCSSFITSLNAKTGGKVVAETDDEIKALVAELQADNVEPSSACCSIAESLLSDACACDASVQAVAKAVQNLNPKEFQTVGSVFLVACGKETCLDTCRLDA